MTNPQSSCIEIEATGMFFWGGEVVKYLLRVFLDAQGIWDKRIGFSLTKLKGQPLMGRFVNLAHAVCILCACNFVDMSCV